MQTVEHNNRLVYAKSCLESVNVILHQTLNNGMTHETLGQFSKQMSDCIEVLAKAKETIKIHLDKCKNP